MDPKKKIRFSKRLGEAVLRREERRNRKTWNKISGNNDPNKKKLIANETIEDVIEKNPTRQISYTAEYGASIVRQMVDRGYAPIEYIDRL